MATSEIPSSTEETITLVEMEKSAEGSELLPVLPLDISPDQALKCPDVISDLGEIITNEQDGDSANQLRVTIMSEDRNNVAVSREGSKNTEQDGTVKTAEKDRSNQMTGLPGAAGKYTHPRIPLKRFCSEDGPGKQVRSPEERSRDKAKSKAEHEKNMGVVDKILETLLKARETGHDDIHLDLKASDIDILLKEARAVLLQEPSLVTVESPVNIYGDIHGQFYDLLQVLDISGPPPKTKHLFLGDYVDRGQHSVEVVCLLLAYKVKYPNSVYVIRGNHETAGVNRIFGFYRECKRRYSSRLWRKMNDCFNCLPFAAVVDDKIFCCHGGLSPELQTMEQIQRIVRPTDAPMDGLLTDLLWADPSEVHSGWEVNERRGISLTFGSDVITEFLEKHQFEFVCRAHEVPIQGYRFHADQQLLTLITAPGSGRLGDNDGAFLHVDTDFKCTLKILQATSKEEKHGLRDNNHLVKGDTTVCGRDKTLNFRFEHIQIETEEETFDEQNDVHTHLQSPKNDEFHHGSTPNDDMNLKNEKETVQTTEKLSENLQSFHKPVAKVEAVPIKLQKNERQQSKQHHFQEYHRQNLQHDLRLRFALDACTLTTPSPLQLHGVKSPECFYGKSFEKKTSSLKFERNENRKLQHDENEFCNSDESVSSKSEELNSLDNTSGILTGFSSHMRKLYSDLVKKTSDTSDVNIAMSKLWRDMFEQVAREAGEGSILQHADLSSSFDEYEGFVHIKHSNSDVKASADSPMNNKQGHENSMYTSMLNVNNKSFWNRRDSEDGQNEDKNALVLLSPHMIKRSSDPMDITDDENESKTSYCIQETKYVRQCKAFSSTDGINLITDSSQETVPVDNSCEVTALMQMFV